jgi:hypothetical protein
MVFMQPLPDKNTPQPGTPTPEDPSGHDPVEETLPDEERDDPSETRSASGYAQRTPPEDSSTS